MKKLLIAILTLAICAGLSAPVFAADYTFGSGPDSGDTFGKPSSTDEPVTSDPMSVNARRNKDAAYLPPPYFYGVPTDSSWKKKNFRGFCLNTHGTTPLNGKFKKCLDAYTITSRAAIFSQAPT